MGMDGRATVVVDVYAGAGLSSRSPTKQHVFVFLRCELCSRTSSDGCVSPMESVVNDQA